MSETVFKDSSGSRVQIVTNYDKIIKWMLIDFVDEMDNDEQDEITILIAGS